MYAVLFVFCLGVAQYSGNVPSASEQALKPSVRPGMTRDEVEEILESKGLVMLLLGNPFHNPYREVWYTTKGIKVCYIGEKVVEVTKQ